jgi:hypothetical protein
MFTCQNHLFYWSRKWLWHLIRSLLLLYFFLAHHWRVASIDKHTAVWEATRVEGLEERWFVYWAGVVFAAFPMYFNLVLRFEVATLDQRNTLTTTEIVCSLFKCLFSLWHFRIVSRRTYLWPTLFKFNFQCLDLQLHIFVLDLQILNLATLSLFLLSFVKLSCDYCFEDISQRLQFTDRPFKIAKFIHVTVSLLFLKQNKFFQNLSHRSKFLP